MKFVVTQVQRTGGHESLERQQIYRNFFDDVRIDGFVWLKIERNLLLLSFIREDRTNINNKSIRWHSVVELQALLRACDRREHGKPVDTRFDIRRCSVLGGQHIRRLGQRGLSSNRHLINMRISWREMVHTFGGRIKLIIDVPALEERQDRQTPLSLDSLNASRGRTHPLALSKLLINFFIFHS